MRIEVKGRNVPVSERLKEHIERRFRVIGRQVSKLAELEVELSEEHNRTVPESHVAEATLHLKGVTLRARSSSGEVMRAVNKVSDELGVQVKRHRVRRRKRRETREATLAVERAAASSGRLIPVR